MKMDITITQMAKTHHREARKFICDGDGIFREEIWHTVNRHADVMLKGGTVGALTFRNAFAQSPPSDCLAFILGDDDIVENTIVNKDGEGLLEAV